MLFQTIGLILAVIGIIFKINNIFIIGGLICLLLDIWGILTGRLKPLFPIISYIVGYIIVGSWLGILWGSLFGNVFDYIFMLAAILGFTAFSGIKRIFRKS